MPAPVVLKSGRLLCGVFCVSASDLGPAVEVGFLYPHFFFEKVGFLVGIPHGGDDMVFRSTTVRVADDLSSLVRIKMTIDARSIPMMRLGDGAGREILQLLQCLMPLVDGGGLGSSPIKSSGLKKNLEFRILSCNFQEI
jgi:hypothetical protein